MSHQNVAERTHADSSFESSRLVAACFALLGFAGALIALAFIALAVQHGVRSHSVPPVYLRRQLFAAAGTVMILLPIPIAIHFVTVVGLGKRWRPLLKPGATAAGAVAALIVCVAAMVTNTIYAGWPTSTTSLTEFAVIVSVVVSTSTVLAFELLRAWRLWHVAGR